MKNSSGLIGAAMRSPSSRAGFRRGSGTLFAVGVAALVLLVQSFAAAGTITGKVFDREKKAALPGANIIVKGTSIGAAGNLDGVYTISNAPEGEQTVVVSYIGYITMSVVVTVPENGTVHQDFYLQAVAVQGKEVVITAQAGGQLEAINQQVSANTIKNIVSSSRIHELPDENAATALSRLPGLSLMQTDKVVIRGLQAKMNVVLVNGIELPSTDMNDRSTNLGFISSNMLSGIEVVKVVTPDMDASAIGGVVNLRLREAPVGLHFDVLSQGTYNTQDRTNPGQNYKVWASVSNRFFDNKLGVFLQANANRFDGGNDQSNANYGLLGPWGDEPYGLATMGMSGFEYADEVNVVEDKGASVMLDYILPHGKLGLQNTLAFTNNDMKRYRDIFTLANTSRRYTVVRDVYDKALYTNAFQGEYQFGDVKAEAAVSHSYADKSTDLRYGDASETGFGFVNMTEIDMTYNFNEAQRLQLTPDDFYKIHFDPNNWLKAVILQDGVTRDEAFNEHLYNGRLDLSMPVSLTKYLSGTLKFGGKVKYSVRENDIEASHARLTEPMTGNSAAAEWMRSLGMDPTQSLKYSDFMDQNYKRGEYYQIGGYKMNRVINTEYMDQYFRLAPAGWPLKRFASGSDQNDFNGKETFAAGYLMGDFKIGPRLTLLTGVRYEHFNMDYKSNFVFVTHPEDGVDVLFDTLNTVNRNDINWFPNAQIRYKATDWFDVRAAYSKTISRPDYLAILPNTYIQDANTGSAGNPKLKPAVSNNLDLYTSLYNNKIGLFTIGGFYKHIDDMFYNTTLVYQTLTTTHNVAFPTSAALQALKLPSMAPSAQIGTYVNNPNPAMVRGVEADWQTNFWYLPKPLNALVLNINYTRVWSGMDYQQTRIISERKLVDGRYRTVYSEVDTVRNARLLYQGDHQLNFALGLDYKGFSGRFSFNLQSNVINSVGNRPEYDTFTGNVYKWDYTIQQKLPIRGLSVSLSGVNIFNNSIKSFQKFRRVENGEIIDNLTYTTYTPRRFEFGLRYTY